MVQFSAALNNVMVMIIIAVVYMLTVSVMFG